MAMMIMPNIVMLVFVTMLSKLLLLTCALVWLARKAAADEAWEYENAWDSGWSERDGGLGSPVASGIGEP